MLRSHVPSGRGLAFGPGVALAHSQTAHLAWAIISMLSVGTIGRGRCVDPIIYKRRNRIGMRRRGGLRHPARLKATAVFNERSRDGGPLDRNNVRFFVGRVFAPFEKPRHPRA